MPDIMRMVEPELPQSSGAAGELSCCAQAVDDDGSLFIALDLAAQSANTAQRAGAIGAGSKVVEARAPCGERRQHGIAMGNGFVARHAQTSQNVARGFDRD